MSSITLWHRLEPRPRNTDMAESLAARIHDPLWTLARQWQFGEFQGEDAGSAVAAHHKGSSMPITRVRNGPKGAVRKFDRTHPLEVDIERESNRTSLTTNRDAAESGVMWLRLLEQANLGHLKRRYIDHALLRIADQSLAHFDPISVAYSQILAGRIPDGASLYSELDAALRPTPPQQPALPALPDVGADRDAVTVVALEWLKWWDDLIREPETSDSAWLPEKLEYQFSIAAPSESGEIVLTATEYTGGNLDWHAFHLDSESALDAQQDLSRIQTIERTMTPTPIVIPGNPASRFWEFEDGAVDFARLAAEPEDIARLMHAEFGLLFGDDWLQIPIDLDFGTIFRTDLLEIKDTFGTTTIAEPATNRDSPEAGWGFFHISETEDAISSDQQPHPYFLLTPTMGASLEGEAIEDVLLLRDEMANLAWAVERRIQSMRGRTVDRADQYQQQRNKVVPAPTPAAAQRYYQMFTTVPDYWIPFIPVKSSDADGRSVILQRGSVRDPETGDLRRPLGQLLIPNEPYFLNEEEASRSGLRLSRRYRYCRTSSGESFLWTSRIVRIGQGEGSSGLSYDKLIVSKKSEE